MPMRPLSVRTGAMYLLLLPLLLPFALLLLETSTSLPTISVTIFVTKSGSRGFNDGESVYCHTLPVCKNMVSSSTPGMGSVNE